MRRRDGADWRGWGEAGEMPMDVIKIEHLHKTYRTGFRMRRREVIRDLSLTVREGEIYGFIGPNGAGKTSTIKILVGLAHATSGTVRLFGEPGPRPEQKAHIGFLPERPYFYEYLTPMEFLDFYGQLFGVPAEVRRRRADALLERVKLSEWRDTPLHKFSKGMLQRVGVAQALINDPKLVILDEPMSGLDPLGRMLIRDLIVGLRDQGKTVFFSSHILSDVELICDRVGILVDGRMRGEGSLDELLADKTRFIEIVVRPPRERLRALQEALKPLAMEVSVQADERLLIRAADEAQKRKVLERLHQEDLLIESLVPRRESLEELFVDELSRESERRVVAG